MITLPLKLEQRILEAVRTEIETAATATPPKLTYHTSHDTAEGKPPAIVVVAVQQEEDPMTSGVWRCTVAVELRLPLGMAEYEDELFWDIQTALDHEDMAGLGDAELGFPQGFPADFDEELSRELAEGVRGTDIVRVHAFNVWCARIFDDS